MDIASFLNWWQSALDALFAKYAELGRPILDFLHIIFDSIFNTLVYVMMGVSLIFLFMMVYTSFKGKKEEKKIDPSYTPQVTIQIPTYNELVAIRCAEACLSFEYPKEKFEILIGDDSNQKEISQKIASFAAQHPQITVIKRASNVGYKPGNLNNMLPHSKGEFIVIFDSDFIPKPDFLSRIIQPFKDDQKIAAVQAKWSFVNLDQNMITILGSTILNVYHYITLPFFKRRRSLSLLCGSAEAIRTSTLQSMGGWDSGNLTEDIEYSIRLLNSGHKIIYLEDLSCDSEVPHKSRDLYRQQMRWGYGVISSAKKHFREIITSKNTSLEDKFCIGVVCGGYFLSFLLFALLLFGALSILTHAPAPIDWKLFITETIRNILLTAGLLICSIVALKRSRQTRVLFPMLASSFSFGIIMTLYVNKGIYKALLGRPMEWFMLSKKGNEQF